MNVCFDSNKLISDELTKEEILMLLGIRLGVVITPSTYKTLHNEGYICIDSIDKDTLYPDKIHITLEGEAALDGILASSRIKSEDNMTYDELASKMIELFPKGRKPGTNYLWRASKLEIARKLKTLATKYKVDLEPSKVLQATSNYVKSFNNDFTTMRLLKYFIFKIEVKDGKEEFNSELLSRIENLEQDTKEEQDWLSTLR